MITFLVVIKGERKKLRNKEMEKLTNKFVKSIHLDYFKIAYNQIKVFLEALGRT